MRKSKISNLFIIKIIMLPITICKYFYIGLKTVFLNDCLFLYSVFKGIVTFPMKLFGLIIKPSEHKKEKQIKKKKEKVAKVKKEKPEKVKKEKEAAYEKIDLKEFMRLRNMKIKKIKDIKKKNSLNAIAETKKAKEDVKTKKKKKEEAYINEKVKSPSKFEQDINDFTRTLLSLPKRISEKFKNNQFARQRKNQEMMKREALLIDFDGKDAEKSENKVLYEYVAKDKNGRVVKDYFEAYSKVEVHSFLLSEGYEVYSIKTNKWIQMFHKNTNENSTKFKTKDLIFFITQLSTYIKAGIPLVESLKVLEAQYKNKKYKRILTSIIYDLTMGENFSEALEKQNVAFPRLLINMVKTAEMTGELPEVLDDQAEYYTQTGRAWRIVTSNPQGGNSGPGLMQPTMCQRGTYTCSVQVRDNGLGITRTMTLIVHVRILSSRVLKKYRNNR